MCWSYHITYIVHDINIYMCTLWHYRFIFTTHNYMLYFYIIQTCMCVSYLESTHWPHLYIVHANARVYHLNVDTLDAAAPLRLVRPHQDKPNYQHFRHSFTKALTDVGLEVRSMMDQGIQGLMKSDKSEVCWNKSERDGPHHLWTFHFEELVLGPSFGHVDWYGRPNAYLSISVWTSQFFIIFLGIQFNPYSLLILDCN